MLNIKTDSDISSWGVWLETWRYEGSRCIRFKIAGFGFGYILYWRHKLHEGQMD